MTVALMTIPLGQLLLEVCYFYLVKKAFTYIIQAYGIHGDAAEAIRLFEAMQYKKVKPNSITIINLLNACSQAGYVQQALQIYYSMKDNFGIEPSIAHQSCVVDALGRAGQLEEAENFILNLDKHSHIMWQSLLSASRLQGDIERSQRAADRVLENYPKNSATFVLLANAYGSAERWQDQQNVLQQMKRENIQKIPGSTWVTINNQSENFHMDTEHLYHLGFFFYYIFCFDFTRQKQEIKDFLVCTRDKIIEKYGYVPDTNCVLQPDKSKEEKMERLLVHAEKMALAWAVISAFEK